MVVFAKFAEVKTCPFSLIAIVTGNLCKASTTEVNAVKVKEAYIVSSPLKCVITVTVMRECINEKQGE